GEGAPAPGHHRHARAVVGVQCAPDLGELPVQSVVGGVEDVGTVDRDEHHAVRLALERQVLVLAVVHEGFYLVGGRDGPRAPMVARRHPGGAGAPLGYTSQRAMTAQRSEPSTSATIQGSTWRSW